MQNKNTFSWDHFNEIPIIGIVRGMERALIWKLVQPYLDAGFYTLEVTMNTPNAPSIITDLIKEFPELNVGAGTVCTEEDLNLAIKAGAQFIVMPVLDEKVIKSSVSQGIPIFPGAFSPTEIYKAHTLGASAVKIFPATQLGPQYLKDVLGPLNKARLVPTGGVSLGNINSFFKAGAYGVGMGSSLFEKRLVDSNNTEGLKNHFLAIKSQIKEFL